MKCSIHYLCQTLKFCMLNFVVGFFCFWVKGKFSLKSKRPLDRLKSFTLKARVWQQSFTCDHHHYIRPGMCVLTSWGRLAQSTSMSCKNKTLHTITIFSLFWLWNKKEQQHDPTTPGKRKKLPKSNRMYVHHPVSNDLYV